MSKKLSRTFAVIMLVISVVFIIFALNNPQAGFPWSNTITYTIYGIWSAAMIILFIAPFGRRKK